MTNTVARRAALYKKVSRQKRSGFGPVYKVGAGGGLGASLVLYARDENISRTNGRTRVELRAAIAKCADGNQVTRFRLSQQRQQQSLALKLFVDSSARR